MRGFGARASFGVQGVRLLQDGIPHDHARRARARRLPST